MRGMTTEDAKEPSADETEQRWWKLLLRAFEIPDIVSVGHREAALAHALLRAAHYGRANQSPQTEAARLDQKRWVADAAAVLHTVAKMGAAGELDELFVAIRFDRTDRSTLATRVLRKSGVDSRDLVEQVFKAVTTCVQARPHRNEVVVVETPANRAGHEPPRFSLQDPATS
jgi:hypothetical protein